MNIVSILTKVPWGLVIDRVPQVIEKANAVVAKLKSGGSKEEAVKDMAQLIDEQAKLIETLSNQNNQLFEAIRALANQQRILLGITVTSFIVALGTLIYVAITN